MSFVRFKYFNPRKWRRLSTKQFRLRNPHTGEVWEGDIDEPPKRKKPQGGKWIAMDQLELMNLVNARVRGQEMRLLLFLMHKCSWNNKVHCRRKEIAQVLGCTTQTVYSLVKRLASFGLVWPDPDDRAGFLLNPMICWKGNPELRFGAYGAFKQLFPELTPETLLRFSYVAHERTKSQNV